MARQGYDGFSNRPIINSSIYLDYDNQTVPNIDSESPGAFQSASAQMSYNTATPSEALDGKNRLQPVSGQKLVTLTPGVYRWDLMIAYSNTGGISTSRFQWAIGDDDVTATQTLFHTGLLYKLGVNSALTEENDQHTSFGLITVTEDTNICLYARARESSGVTQIRRALLMITRVGNA